MKQQKVYEGFVAVDGEVDLPADKGGRWWKLGEGVLQAVGGALPMVRSRERAVGSRK